MTVNPTADNTDYWAAWPNVWANAFVGEAIISGCSISKGTGDWDIDVTSGTILVGNSEVSITSGTVTLTQPSNDTDMGSGEGRIDLVTVDSSDTLAVTEGTAASDPTTPDIPSGEVVLGFVHVENGDSTVADSDIFDVPALLGDDSARYGSSGSHTVDLTHPGGYAFYTDPDNTLTIGNQTSYVEETGDFMRNYGVDFSDIDGMTLMGYVDPNGVGLDFRIFDFTNNQEVISVSTDTSNGFAWFTGSTITNNPSGEVDLKMEWRAQSDTATTVKMELANLVLS